MKISRKGIWNISRCLKIGKIRCGHILKNKRGEMELGVSEVIAKWENIWQNKIGLCRLMARQITKTSV